MSTNLLFARTYAVFFANRQICHYCYLAMSVRFWKREIHQFQLRTYSMSALPLVDLSEMVLSLTTMSCTEMKVCAKSPYFDSWQAFHSGYEIPLEPQRQWIRSRSFDARLYPCRTCTSLWWHRWSYQTAERWPAPSPWVLYGALLWRISWVQSCWRKMRKTGSETRIDESFLKVPFQSMLGVS